MHNVLFLFAWPLAIVCPLLPKKRLLLEAALFLVCQLCLWHFTFLAMSSPSWNDSTGDMLIPAIITLPLVLFSCLIAARGAIAEGYALRCRPDAGSLE
jgi:hypothetical protein